MKSPVSGPKNLGEVQTRPVPNIGTTNFGNYDTSKWGKSRMICTTGGTGSERNYDRTYEKKSMQDFKDSPSVRKGGMTYGR